MQSDFDFRLMSLEFRLRDFFNPPERILREAGIRDGMTVLDFGCGPGGFSLAAAKLVGPKGCIYASDIHPLAMKSLQRAVDKKGFRNIRTILGSRMAGVPGGIVDMALLYDVLHDLHEPGLILVELHRVLKPKGVLSVRDHHMKKGSMLSTIIGSGLFSLARSSRRAFQFEKTETSETGS
jgi:ubiquinone/menaquinone biosynthesis C-methylase UbiE